MAERFQRLYSLPSNLYREGSPVVIEAATLLKDSVSGNVVAQFKFRCVSNRKIRAVKIGIEATDVAGISLPGIDEYQYLDLDIDDEDAFGSDKAIIMPSPVTRSFSVRSLSVILWDGTVWSASNIGETDALPAAESLNNALKDTRLVNEYKFCVCEQAKFAPASVGELWRCTCGAWNHKTTCRSCRARKAHVLDLFSAERLTEHLNKRIAEEQAKQAERTRQEEERKAAAKKRKQCAVRICVIAAAVLLLVIAVVGIIVTKPYRMIKDAEALVESGQYMEAVSLLQEANVPEKTQAIEQNVFAIMEADIQEAIDSGDYVQAMELIKQYSVLPTSEEYINAVQSICPHKEQEQVYSSNTCTDDGYERKTCTVCGYVEEETLMALGHTDETAVVEEPTCSTMGIEATVCVICGEETSSDIPMLEHLFNVVMTKAPTCTEDGMQTKTCELCGHFEEEVLSVVEHSYKDTIVEKATCTSGGLQKTICSICDKVAGEKETPPLGHDYSVVVKTTQPTCEEDGTVVNKCSRCESTVTNVSGTATGHKYSKGKCTTCGALKPSEGLSFALTESGYAVVGMGSCTDSTVVIPERYNGKPVVRIESEAFSACLTLRELVIPDTVESIGENAIYHCVNLDKVVLGSGVKKIETGGFYGCVYLSEIHISDIAACATMEGGIYIFSAHNTFLPYTPGTVPPKLYLNGELVTNLVIPGSVKTISRSAFNWRYELETVVLSDGVERISERAFAVCRFLQSVTLPTSVNYIGKEVFDSCGELSTIYYGGTMAQWNAINKHADAFDSSFSVDITVKCTDGEIKITQ